MKKKSCQNTRDNRCHPTRKGAVAVEFAVVAPMLLAIVVGMLELNRIYDVQNVLDTAAREGARFAAMDRSGILQEGETANSKLTSDLMSLLASSGIPTAEVVISIIDPDNPGVEFDLDNPANDLRLFEVQIDLPYSAISFTPVSQTDDYMLTSSVTFRNGRAPAIQ